MNFKSPLFSRMLSVASAFVVFGIIDNGIMVTAGSAIDASIGEAFGISPMASAGLGNTLSDVVGIVMGRSTEKYLHNLIRPDESVKITQRQVIISETIGIIIGCLIGMSILLFI